MAVLTTIICVKHYLNSIFDLVDEQHFGIMAIANMRGGGEYGEKWQKAGKRENLQNCLTDFQVTIINIGQGYILCQKIEFKPKTPHF